MQDKLISIVIPVFNEAENLSALFERLFKVLSGIKYKSEIIFVNDGSKDLSLPILLKEYQKHPDIIRIIDFNGNFGQHTAIMAGFKESKGNLIITMDADLQNPPEEIPRIISEFESGHDVIGTVRMNRKDTFFRRYASKIVNKIMNKVTGFSLRDYGCMLRGYSREIIDIINECNEVSTFIPALAQKFASNPIEIEVSHNAREKGVSKYNVFRLIRLQFDLMTAFSLFPLQLITILGMFIFITGLILSCFALSGESLNVILTGIIVSCLGITGEYTGRIYQEVRKRPRYVIRKIYEGEGDKI